MKDLDQRKDEFVATAAHELRNPLAALLGYTQLLQKQVAQVDNTPPGVTTYLDAMSKQVKRLNALVEHLLDASRIQLGRIVLEKSTFNIVDLARLVTNTARAADENGHSITVTASDDNIVGEWDLTRIEQVITNLVSNAVRYSPRNTAVQVNLSKSGGKVRVEVIDQGPGVPPDQRPALFDRYYQGAGTRDEQSTARPMGRRGGLGLGLYISSEIVKAHDGEIGMDPNPDGGSIFWFSLPAQD